MLRISSLFSAALIIVTCRWFFGWNAPTARTLRPMAWRVKRDISRPRLVSRVLPGGRRLSDGVPVDAVLKGLTGQQSSYVLGHTLTDAPVGDIGDTGDVRGGEDIGAPEEWRVVIERFLLVNVQGRPHQPPFRQRLQ